jgi:uncharacterized membrane protein HdeD (DUF308 family)
MQRIEHQTAENVNVLLDQRRLSLTLRSGVGLVFAIAFFWPTLTFSGLVGLFAAYAFVDGILILSTGGWGLAQRPVWPLLIAGCADIVAAAAAYFSPGLTFNGFGNLLAAWAVAMAAGCAISCATLREADPDYLLLLSGIAAGLFARALLSHTAGDVVVLSTWLGFYALTSGILLFKLALQRFRPIFVDLST